MSLRNAEGGRRAELAQLNPSATTATTLYTTPLGGAEFLRVRIANRSTATTFRLWIAKAGAADNNIQYDAYDTPIGANGVAEFEYEGLESGDLIRVYAGAATLTFKVNGTEY